MEVLLLAVMGAVNILCFMIGARVGQQAAKGEKVEMPSIIDPLKVVRDRREEKEAKAEQDRVEAILRNIECYDGTDAGQQDIPRG